MKKLAQNMTRNISQALAKRGRAFILVAWIGVVTAGLIVSYPLLLMLTELTKDDLMPYVDMIKGVWIWYGGISIGAFGGTNIAERVKGYGLGQQVVIEEVIKDEDGPDRQIRANWTEEQKKAAREEI